MDYNARLRVCTYPHSVRHDRYDMEAPGWCSNKPSLPCRQQYEYHNKFHFYILVQWSINKFEEINRGVQRFVQVPLLRSQEKIIKN